jgi:UDP-glucose 4-epimerase
MLHSLVTGGAGFIGSHLCERLLGEGHRVTAIDDFSTGSRANIAHLASDDRFELIEGTVLDEALMERLIARAGRVFHLASAVGVRLIMEQPVKTIETIFNGSDVVLRHCAAHHTRVVITSTSEVYGKGVAIPFREDEDTRSGATSKHRWAYACAKALDEFLALAHFKESRLPVAIVRLFNTVGPRQTGQYGMVVPRFVGAALRNEPLVVYGDGSQARCFAHVLDVVEGLSRILEQEACFGKVTNLGADDEITINDLAARIVEVTGSRSRIDHVPSEAVYGDGFEDMLRRVPSLERARELIGYRPRRDLRSIIEDVAASMRAQEGPCEAGDEIPRSSVTAR